MFHLWHLSIRFVRPGSQAVLFWASKRHLPTKQPKPAGFCFCVLFLSFFVVLPLFVCFRMSFRWALVFHLAFSGSPPHPFSGDAMQEKALVYQTSFGVPNNFQKMTKAKQPGFGEAYFRYFRLEKTTWELVTEALRMVVFDYVCG